MSEDTIGKINEIINKNNINSILEIGTAIGYSTICFANNSCVKNITSIERDNERFNIAELNVKKSKLSNIKLIHDDALDVNINDKFDLIIIDAAKSQNLNFLNKYKSNLNDNGIIIIDNLSFHGLVGKSGEIKSKNLRQMVRKIESFIDYLNNNEEFSVQYIEVGDTLGICRKENI
jgi:predicted O-methyltransferase YrrM